MSGSENPLSEPRAAASLSASLLARRGGARPAMRRQALGGLHAPHPINDDLGWNDMGEDEPVAISQIETPAPVPAVAPIATSPITEQLQALAERINSKPARRRASPASLAGTSRKAAFTLRLDAERHLRLRLLSAMTNSSAQQLLTDALDALIAGNDQLRDLAKQVESGKTEDADMKRGS